MGGKSRKKGGVSDKLIQRIKSGGTSPASNSSGTAGKKRPQGTTGLVKK